MLNKIKADALIARKAAIKDKSIRALNDAALYATIVGAITRIGIDERREITDADSIGAVKKILKGVIETITYLTGSELEGEQQREKNALREKIILEQYLPKQMTTEELEIVITEHSNGIERNSKAKGLILKHLKLFYDGLYDGKQAAEIVTKILN